MTEKPRLVLARPADKSFEAYAAFINGFLEALTGKPACEISEAETEAMRAGWREFWGGEEKKEEPAPSGKPHRSRVQKGTDTSG